MPFEVADERINRAGRPVGVLNKPNRVSEQIREHIATLVDENISMLREDLQTLPADLRVKYLIELTRFILPQMKSINYSNNAEFLQENLQDINVTIVK